MIDPAVFPVFLVAVLRSLVSLGYTIPFGVLLGGVGLLYVAAFALVWLDTPLMTMTRRELAALFFSPVLYLVAIPAAFVSPWISGALYVLVALIWLVPDPRIEKAFRARQPPE